MTKDIVGLISKSLELINTIRAADKELEAALLKKQLSEVYGDLVEIKNQVIDLKDENYKLIRRLEGNDTVSKLRKAFNPESSSGYFILSEEIDDYKPGNYCNGCFQNNAKAIGLIAFGSGFKCPSCKTFFNNPDYRVPPRFI